MLSVHIRGHNANIFIALQLSIVAHYHIENYPGNWKIVSSKYLKKVKISDKINILYKCDSNKLYIWFNNIGVCYILLQFYQ